jgi:NAD(P)-dependent dehydrogenase (short-subunit alcohol dehydrogenase family)
MVGDHPVAGLDVGSLEHNLDVLEWHVQVAKAADDLRRDDLLWCVAPVSAFYIHVDRLQQAELVVVAKHPHAQVRGPGEVADGEGGGQDEILGLTQCESQTPNPRLTLPTREGRRSCPTVLRRREDAMSESRLAGRTAIVTGAGRGIGRAVAELYAREGARVVIASRSAHGSAAAAEAIEAAGGTAIAKPTNIGLKADVVDMVRFAVETYGRLDILVNNAQSWGTRNQPTGMPVPTPLESFDEAELDWTFDTGFRGTFWAMQAAFPHMRERGGRIINLASMYGMIGNAGTVGYNVTKEAVRALTRTAAREWARYAITANVVAPTAKTDSADEIERADPEGMSAAVASIPMGRLGDPRLDIAPAALFLATDDARYITGQTVGVDGGSFLHA